MTDFRPGWLQRRVAQSVENLRRVPRMYGGTKPDECTGLTAQWCPVHGDCVCHDDGIPELHIAPTLDDPQCPLHKPGSDHGEITTGSNPPGGAL